MREIIYMVGVTRHGKEAPTWHQDAKDVTFYSEDLTKKHTFKDWVQISYVALG